MNDGGLCPYKETLGLSSEGLADLIVEGVLEQLYVEIDANKKNHLKGGGT
jgi:hypothetical protein